MRPPPRHGGAARHGRRRPRGDHRPCGRIEPRFDHLGERQHHPRRRASERLEGCARPRLVHRPAELRDHRRSSHRRLARDLPAQADRLGHAVGLDAGCQHRHEPDRLDDGPAIHRERGARRTQQVGPRARARAVGRHRRTRRSRSLGVRRARHGRRLARHPRQLRSLDLARCAARGPRRADRDRHEHARQRRHHDRELGAPSRNGHGQRRCAPRLRRSGRPTARRRLESDSGRHPCAGGAHAGSGQQLRGRRSRRPRVRGQPDRRNHGAAHPRRGNAHPSIPRCASKARSTREPGA